MNNPRVSGDVLAAAVMYAALNPETVQRATFVPATYHTGDRGRGRDGRWYVIVQVENDGFEVAYLAMEYVSFVPDLWSTCA
jgi:hypothetical protein